MKKLKELRKKYPKFVYSGYNYRISNNNLEILFDFKTEPDIYFRPQVVIEGVDKVKNIDNLVFNLGLVEMISYWKATCSPVIDIRAGSLSADQIKWWRELIIKGLGQFFFENKINYKEKGFLTIKAKGDKGKVVSGKATESFLIPVGGGKDSIVTFELLKKNKVRCMSLNPTRTREVMKVAGCKNPIIVRRRIDQRLIQLNKKGFLNGHTPFSAYLAFLSVLVSYLFGFKYIAFSNERSSNEGNVKYLDTVINHQWSKSFEFEAMFRKYSKNYLVKGIEYFSFMRPLYEIQIAKLFSKYPKYFPVFLSCNEAHKTHSGTKKPFRGWCGKCSKCLFVFTVLYPFIEEKKLVKIFNKNLFQDKSLLPIMLQLIGEKGFKPFECVGTHEESLVAFYLSWKKDKEKSGLLKYFEDKVLVKHPNLEKESKEILTSFNKQHNLPKRVQSCLKKP